MSQASIEKRMQKLRDEINHHNYSYYALNRPEITDREFDQLLQELIDLEKEHPDLITPDSPTQRVGGDVQTELKSVRHAVPMMSIDNTYNEAEVRAFDERVRKGLGGEQPAYVLEPKIDGASVSIRYEDGQLVLAATRGRGNVGDDITINARTIKAIPLTLRKDGASIAPPRILEVRGEVYMDNEDFQRVNKEIASEGEEPYANPRNLTSGTLRRLDPKIVAKRRLRFLAHGLGQVEPVPVKSYWEWAQLLRKWGIPLPKEVWRVDNIDEAIKCIHEFEKIRPKLPYMTDGIVLKVDHFLQRDRLGATSKAPRWVIAYKYETEQQPTVLKDCRWQVGKGGTLTPVGDLEPVFVGGVTVTHVTLHNIDQIRRLDIHYGDTVVVERAGEVIPYVVEVVKEKRPRGAKPIEAPAKCPICHTKVEREELPEGIAAYRCVNTECDEFYARKKVKRDKLPEVCPVCSKKVEVLDAGIAIYCPNTNCPAQIKERLRWFAGRSQMDITGLGESIIDQLVDRKMLKTYGDIFRLRPDQIADLTNEVEVGEKSAKKIIDSIRAAESRGASVTPPLGVKEPRSPSELKKHIRWLAGAEQMDIKGLGEKTIDQMVDEGLIKSPADLFRIKVEQLAALKREVRVGDKTASKIAKSIQAAKSHGLGRVLAGLGIPHVGTTVARNVAQWAGSSQRLMHASEADLHRATRFAGEQDEDPGKVDDLAARIYTALREASVEAKKQLRQAQEASELVSAILSFAKAAGIAGRVKERRAEQLVEEFEDGAMLLTASEGDIREAFRAERVIARSLHEFLHSHQGKGVFDDLHALGVKLREDQPETEVSSPVSGKTVVITGTFSRISREQLQDRLRRLGAKVTDSVSSKTDILLKGDDAGSKLDKAASLGTVSIWDEDDLMGKLPELLHE
jgi:DNA ligase (NAD+)